MGRQIPPPPQRHVAIVEANILLWQQAQTQLHFDELVFGFPLPEETAGINAIKEKKIENSTPILLELLLQSLALRRFKKRN
jgi:hypothetical protein